jgi:hypothetical protein
MSDVITITEDEWIHRFKPITNSIDPNASYNGRLFETYGDELVHVMHQPTERIWTLLDEDGTSWIASGYHYVNRMGYFICEVPVPDGEFYEIPEEE